MTQAPTPEKFRSGYLAFQAEARRDAMYKTATFLVGHFWGKTGESRGILRTDRPAQDSGRKLLHGTQTVAIQAVTAAARPPRFRLRPTGTPFMLVSLIEELGCSSKFL
jgi:hypothetical protein